MQPSSVASESFFYIDELFFNTTRVISQELGSVISYVRVQLSLLILYHFCS